MAETSVSGFPFSISFMVDGSERVRTQLAARGQGVAAKTQHGRLMRGSRAALGA